MEIDQSESILTFYPDAENQIEIKCPECAAKKKLNAIAYKGKFKIYNIKCPCGFNFKCSFEFRRSYRMNVKLAGEYTILNNSKSGEMLIEDLSLSGVGFVNMSVHLLCVGQQLEVKFRLDDAQRTLVRKKVKITSSNGTDIGAEFVEKAGFEKALGFYLKHL